MITSVVDEHTWAPPRVGINGVSFRAGASTHPGLVRTINEDSMLASPPVYLVADGMGGHRLGDVASAIVTKRFAELAQLESIDVKAVEDCIARCQAEISALGDDTGAAPGSTLVSAVYVVIDETSYWLLANIGDSRAYCFRDHQLEQLSHDHSVVQELVDAGEIEPEAAVSHPERHVITRALGAIEDASADFSLIPVQAGTRILLCSDGISSELDDAIIAELLESSVDARQAAQSLVARAVAVGGHDNATAVVIEVLGDLVHEDTAGNFKPTAEDTIPRVDRGTA